jgi:hypothetical protein
MKKVCRDKNNEEKFSDPIANNVRVQARCFILGISAHCRFVKNIAIKIKKLLTEIYIAIFLLAGNWSEVISY